MGTVGGASARLTATVPATRGVVREDGAPRRCPWGVRWPPPGPNARSVGPRMRARRWVAGGSREVRQ
ncbi:hypothetical protein FTX61_20505 [Nitriliruptoraceae bacterium ZYF776]|nr:hypothetical protein [Profundirhabdus halotolerans]